MWHAPGSAGLGLSVLSDSATACAAMLAFKAHPKGLHIEIPTGGTSC